MGRSDNSGQVEPGGFVEYDKRQLPKVDSMRRDKSQPDFYGVPIISDANAMFVSAASLGNKPASCYTCDMQQPDRTCRLLGPGVKVEKVTGHRDSGDPIEYWPCCGEHNYGTPQQSGQPSYSKELSTPLELGLVWINAPETGQKFGGANCGGVSGGDDCDHYMVHGKKEKWDVKSAYCRVLAHEVEGGAVCALWHDDDELQFAEAQMLLRGDSLDTVDKKRLVKSIVGRSD